jgi:hypothetical protein
LDVQQFRFHWGLHDELGPAQRITQTRVQLEQHPVGTASFELPELISLKLARGDDRAAALDRTLAANRPEEGHSLPNWGVLYTEEVSGCERMTPVD